MVRSLNRPTPAGPPLRAALGAFAGLLVLAAALPAQQTPTERVPLTPPAAAAAAPTPLAPGDPQPLQLPAGAHSFQVYDVADITGSVQGLPYAPDELGTRDPALAAERLAQFEDLERLRVAAGRVMGSLVEVVHDFIEPPLVDGRDELRAFGTELLALRGNDAQQAWLAGFLEAQRAQQALVRVRTWVWTGEHGFARELGMSATPHELLPTRDGVEAFLVRARGAGHSVVTAPEVLATTLQEASVSVFNETSFVSAWELVFVEPNERPILDPVVEVVKEGLELSMRAVPLGTDTWTLDAEVVLSTLQRPIPTELVAVGDGSFSAEISRPVVSRAQMSSVFVVPAGGGALFVTYDQVEERDMLVLLQVDHFDPADAARAAPGAASGAKSGDASGERHGAR